MKYLDQISETKLKTNSLKSNLKFINDSRILFFFLQKIWVIFVEYSSLEETKPDTLASSSRYLLS